MSHTIYVLNIDGLGISNEALIGRVEGTLYGGGLQIQGMGSFYPAKAREYVLSDFGELEHYFDENLTIGLTQDRIKTLLADRYKKAGEMLCPLCCATEIGLMRIITQKQKILTQIDENGDAAFVVSIKPENFLGLGGLLDVLFLYSVAIQREVTVRLIKGYKYYN